MRLKIRYMLTILTNLCGTIIDTMLESINLSEVVQDLIISKVMIESTLHDIVIIKIGHSLVKY